jgi:hypothetical protein
MSLFSFFVSDDCKQNKTGTIASGQQQQQRRQRVCNVNRIVSKDLNEQQIPCSEATSVSGLTETVTDRHNVTVINNVKRPCQTDVVSCVSSTQQTFSMSAQNHCRGCLFAEDLKRYENSSTTRRPVNTAYWALELTAFCRDAAVVGLRNVVRPSTSRLRPAVWLLLIMSGLAFTVYQCTDRISLYFSWPTSVSVRVKYVDSLRFPMTTICNENRVSRRVVDQMGNVHA